MRGQIFKRAHDDQTFLDGTFQASQTDADLILNELTDGFDAAVAQVIDIIGFTAAFPESKEIFHDRDDRVDVQDTIIERHGHSQFSIDDMTADLAKVIALGIEEKPEEKGLGNFNGRRFSRT